MRWIYLDNNATTEPAPAVQAAMAEIDGQCWANPSSVHRFGQQARQRLELARCAVARLIGARERDLVFTSGGTESANLALRGVLEPLLASGGPHSACLVTSRIEHAAVREPAQRLAEAGVELVELAVDGAGRVEPGHLAHLLAERVGPRPALVSVQWANNETGVLQPMSDLALACRRHREDGGRVLLHSDAIQAVGKIPVDVGAVGLDMLSLSAHKFHGPKGVGALYVRRGLRLRGQILGGPQERQRRGGTENVSGIVGAGVAAELAMAFVHDAATLAAGQALRDRFEQRIAHSLDELVVHSAGAGPDGRLWNTSNLGFPRLEAEAILVVLSERGVCASAGAACSSGSLEPSPVLLAMGIPQPIAHGSVRFSLSRHTTAAEVDEAAALVVEVVRRLRQTLPLGA